VLLISYPSNHKRLHSNLENLFLQAFPQTSCVQTIFTSVNRSSFQTLVLSSYNLSIIMYLPRTHHWHVFFHSFYYHLIIWGHPLIVLILFLTLIKSVTVWPLWDALFLTLLNFEINCSETPYDLLLFCFICSNYLCTCWCVLKHVTCLCDYVLNPSQNYFHPLLFSLNPLGHLPTSTINPLLKSNSSSNNMGKLFLLPITPFHPQNSYPSLITYAHLRPHQTTPLTSPAHSPSSGRNAL
jgi:hypothetical protein